MTVLRDRGLVSIQEVRDLVDNAKKAQAEYKKFTQEEIDKVILAIATAASHSAEELGKLAFEETGFGDLQSKVNKNALAANVIYNTIKDKKVVGVLSNENDVIRVGIPKGIIAGLIPSSNPTSTTIFKSLIALKGGNAIIFSPHPGAIKSISETVRILNDAAVKAGAPDGLIQCIETLTLDATNELMSHEDVKLILATGGAAMVKAAYSSGTPAIGVGPGNAPAYIEESANIEEAITNIFLSKGFDNGILCACEESIIVDKVIKDKVVAELEKQGSYMLNSEEKKKVEDILLTPMGTANPQIVGANAMKVAEVAGIEVPEGTTLLVAEEDKVGKDVPFSKEKLSMTMALYTVDDYKKAKELSIELLNNGGLGHSVAIHTKNDDIALEFGLAQPVYRVYINSPASQGAMGITSNLEPSYTIGSGALGGSSLSENVRVEDLVDIQNITYVVEDKTKNLKFL